MLDVLITVDTEVWPNSPTWRQSIRDDMKRFVYGSTQKGDFGLRFQLEMLDSHGLKAVFFVESLFASVVGLEPLREIVSLVSDAGQEVGLHLHTEWLKRMQRPLLTGHTGSNRRDLTSMNRSSSSLRE